MRRTFLVLVLLCATVIGCRRLDNAVPTGDDAAASWAATRDALIEEFLKAQPAFAVYQGRHEFDGQLPDWTKEGIAAGVKLLRDARSRAAAVPGLSGADAFERDYLISHFDKELFWLEDAQFPFSNPAFYLGALDPGVYLTREYAPLEQRLRAYIAYARAVPRAAAQIRANLRLPLARTVLERGVSGFSGYADFYRSDVPRVFAGVVDAALQKEFATANEGAANAMSELAEWLRSQRATATDNFALGPERFARMLKATEGVTTPLAEIEAAGRAELQRDLQALREACATFAPGATVHVVGLTRRPQGVARVPRYVPELRRTADSDGQGADVGEWRKRILVGS